MRIAFKYNFRSDACLIRAFVWTIWLNWSEPTNILNTSRNICDDTTPLKGHYLTIKLLRIEWVSRYHVRRCLHTRTKFAPVPVFFFLQKKRGKAKRCSMVCIIYRVLTVNKCLLRKDNKVSMGIWTSKRKEKVRKLQPFL